MKRLEQLKEDFLNALKRLEEAIKIANSELEWDGVIQRFEFTFELCWKLLKLYNESEGFPCNSPKSCLKEAFRTGIITDENAWLNMLEDRNTSSHVYNKKTASEIAEVIKTRHLDKLKELAQKFGN